MRRILETRTERWILGRSDHEGWRSCWTSWYCHDQRTWISTGEITGRFSNRRTWRSHYRCTCLLDMRINGTFLSQLSKKYANSWRWTWTEE